MIRRKEKIRRERLEHAEEKEQIIGTFQARITGLQKEIRHLHNVYDEYKDVGEAEMILKNGIISKFTSKVEEYRD